MKILIVASDTFPHVGGKSSHIKDLVDGLRGANVDSGVISLSSLGRRNELLVKLLLYPRKLVNTDVFYFVFRGVWGEILNCMVYRWCQQHEPAFISVQDAFAAKAISSTVRRLRIPIALTMHTYFGLEDALDKKMGCVSRAIYNRSLKRELQALDVVDGIATVDQRILVHVEDALEAQGVRRSRRVMTTSIMNFVNVDVFTPPPSPSTRATLRKQYKVPCDSFVAVCTRRLVEKNGVLHAVRAMLHTGEHNVHLLVAGEGPQREAIEDFIRRNALEDKVRMLGAVNGQKVRELYRLADVSLVPSITVKGLQEATSISAIEAMSCGLPTIASNIGGLAELIKHEHTGILVNEADDQVIAEQLVRLMSDKGLYTRVSNNARAYVRDNHSHVAVARLYLDFYRDVST